MTVSIVIPTYQRPHYLLQAIASVLGQKWQDWELTVYDDGGMPETREVIEGFDDPRITHHINARRLGVGGNKLVGWKAATGAYFANLDDDDLWEPGFLSTLVPILDADPSVAIAFGSQTIIDEEGAVNADLTKATEDWYRGGLEPGRHSPIARMMLADQAVPVSTGSLIRSDAVDWSCSPSDDNILVDYWLGYLIVRSGLAAYFHREPLALYRAHRGSASATAGLDWHLSCAECYRQVVRDPQLRELRPIFRERLAAAECRATSLQLGRGDTRAARASSRRAFVAAPSLTTAGLALAARTGRIGRRLGAAWLRHYDPSLLWLTPPSTPPQ